MAFPEARSPYIVLVTRPLQLTSTGGPFEPLAATSAPSFFHSRPFLRLPSNSVSYIRKLPWQDLNQKSGSGQSVEAALVKMMVQINGQFPPFLQPGQMVPPCGPCLGYSQMWLLMVLLLGMRPGQGHRYVSWAPWKPLDLFIEFVDGGAGGGGWGAGGWGHWRCLRSQIASAI